MTDVIAPGPARSGTASGEDEIRINSSVPMLSEAALLFRACLLPLTISTDIRKRIAPPAMLNVSGDILRWVRIYEPKKPKKIRTEKAMMDARKAIHCLCLK